MVSAVSRTERRKSMEKSTNLKGMTLLMKLLPIGNGCISVILIAIAVNIFSAWNKYDMNKGISGGVQIAMVMAMMCISMLVAISVSYNYTFISTLPVKTSKIHVFMSAVVDCSFLIVAALDAVIFVVFGMAEHIPVKAITYLIMYISSRILLCAAIPPGGGKQDSHRTNVVSGFAGFFGYLLAAISNSVTASVIDDNTSYSKSGKIAIAIILGVLFVSAVITRILTNKGIKSKLRLMKVYKGKKKSKKAESYV